MSSFWCLTQPILLAAVISIFIIPLSDYDLQIEVRNREHITIVQRHIYIWLYGTLIQLRTI
jgi:hypothetical protein